MAKIARLLAYIPVMLHVQNIIKIGGETGSMLSKDSRAYNEAVDCAALSLFASAVNDTDINLELTID